MYLGIDLGTSSVKILLVDSSQRIRAQGEAGPGTMPPPPSAWALQHPGGG